MSSDFVPNSDQKKDETKAKVTDKPLIVLSEYGERLESHVKCRYRDKIAVIGIDPASLINSQLDPECLPPIEAGDLVSYLVLETSFYTLQQFKCFKSLEAYNQMVSGFITSVQGKLISDKFVVIGKVRHSQRMNEAPLSVWLICSKEGTIICAHCLGCKAGLAESCSHIASILFYVEAWTRINGKLACTQVKCSWLLPTYVKEVNYAEVKDINFRSAKKLKAELDEKIDGGKVNVVNDSVSGNITSKPLHSTCTPTDKEMNDLFLKLNDCKTRPVILSLVPPYADSFILKSRQIPAMTDLFDPENLKLSYVDLLAKCLEIEITLSDSELNLIEQDTRDQAQTSAFLPIELVGLELHKVILCFTQILPNHPYLLSNPFVTLSYLNLQPRPLSMDAKMRPKQLGLTLLRCLQSIKILKSPNVECSLIRTNHGCMLLLTFCQPVFVVAMVAVK